MPSLDGIVLSMGKKKEISHTTVRFASAEDKEKADAMAEEAKLSLNNLILKKLKLKLRKHGGKRVKGEK